MTWEEEVALELQRSREAMAVGNAGKARTGCRRAVGMALKELYRRESRPAATDFIALIREFIARDGIAAEARAAGERLTARLAADFSAATAEPLEDASLLLKEVGKAMDSSSAGA